MISETVIEPGPGRRAIAVEGVAQQKVAECVDTAWGNIRRCAERPVERPIPTMIALGEEASFPIPQSVSKLQGVLATQSAQVRAPQHLVHPPACGVMRQAGSSGKSGN